MWQTSGKPFQLSKIIFIFPRNRYHMNTFWKKKDWSSQFWQINSFEFGHLEVHHERRLKSTKTGTSTYVNAMAYSEAIKFSLSSMRKHLHKKYM